jgi:hypothetical protein
MNAGNNLYSVLVTPNMSKRHSVVTNISLRLPREIRWAIDTGWQLYVYMEDF